MGPLLSLFPKSSPRFHAILRLRNVRSQQAAYPPCQCQCLQRAGLAPVAPCLMSKAPVLLSPQAGQGFSLRSSTSLWCTACYRFFPQPHNLNCTSESSWEMGTHCYSLCPPAPRHVRELQGASGSLERKEMPQGLSGYWVQYGVGAASKVLHGSMVGTPTPSPEHQKGVSRS